MLFKKLALIGIYCSVFWARKRYGLTVLTYHRVPRFPDLVDPLKVSRDVFERQMRFLKENYLLLSPSEAVRILKRRGNFPEKSCMITFDDGWKDNFTCGYPILKKHNIPALVFLSTDFIGTNRQFWHDKLSTLLNKLPRGGERKLLDKIRVEYPAEIIGKIKAISEVQGHRRRELINSLIIDLKKFSVEQNEMLVVRLRSAFGVQPAAEDPVMLSWSDVEEMAKGGVVFGSHTKSHRLLDRLSIEDVERELTESKKCIEEKIKHGVDFLSYPNGNYDGRIMSIAEKVGYMGAFTCVGGNNVSGTSPYELKRNHIRESTVLGLRGRFSELLFSVELSGLRNDLKRFRPDYEY